MNDLYFGRGNAEQFDDYIDFINYVFGFNGKENDFPKLLPKLYRPECNPTEHSFLAMENGKIKAAVGAFPSEISVCGQTLKCIGIGNVSVHPYARSKGYMKKLVTMAVDDMISQGADFSALGGQRQRYNYFSFDTTGIVYQYTVTPANIRHIYGTGPATLQMTAVGPEDHKSLDAIASLMASGQYVPLRPREELYHILHNWEAQIYVFHDETGILGYCVVLDKTVTEIQAVRESDFPAMVCTLITKLSKLKFQIPEFQPAYMEILEKLCDRAEITSTEMFSVFCYRNVLEAFLQLKSTYTTLPDGRLQVLIHGRAGDENLNISVTNNIISVTDCNIPAANCTFPDDRCNTSNEENYIHSEDYNTPTLELSHLEAMRFFFAPGSIYRRNIPDFAKIWFPVPLWLYSADCV